MRMFWHTHQIILLTNFSSSFYILCFKGNTKILGNEPQRESGNKKDTKSSYWQIVRKEHHIIIAVHQSTFSDPLKCQKKRNREIARQKENHYYYYYIINIWIQAIIIVGSFSTRNIIFLKKTLLALYLKKNKHIQNWKYQFKGFIGLGS